MTNECADYALIMRLVRHIVSVPPVIGFFSTPVATTQPSLFGDDVAFSGRAGRLTASTCGSIYRGEADQVPSGRALRFATDSIQAAPLQPEQLDETAMQPQLERVDDSQSA